MDPASKVLEMGRAEAHTHTHTPRRGCTHNTLTHRENSGLLGENNTQTWELTSNPRATRHEQRGTHTERNATHSRTHARAPQGTAAQLHKTARRGTHWCTAPLWPLPLFAMHCLQCTGCNALATRNLRRVASTARFLKELAVSVASNCTALPTRW